MRKFYACNDNAQRDYLRYRTTSGVSGAGLNVVALSVATLFDTIAEGGILLVGGTAMEHLSDKLGNLLAQLLEADRRFSAYLANRLSAIKSALVTAYCAVVDALY